MMTPPRSVDDLEREIDAMRERIDAQAAYLESLRREVMRMKESTQQQQTATTLTTPNSYKMTDTPASAHAFASAISYQLHPTTRTKPRNDFGREDVSHLPAEYLSQCYVEMDVVGFMETLLFDSDHVENNTVRMTPGAAPCSSIETWRNGAWVPAAQIDEVLTDIVRSAYRIMSRHARKHQESIVKMLGYDLDAFEDLKEFYERLYDDDDPRIQQSIKTELIDLVSAFSSV